MPPRLPSQGFSSFIAFYSCSRPYPSRARSVSILRFQCCRNVLGVSSCQKPSYIEQPGNKRLLHATSRLAASSKDPYQVLGVKPDATAADIKKTYFSLARKFHPDTNPDKGARDKFVEIQEAYDTLKDEKKRAAYDRYGSASQQPGFDPSAFAGARGASDFSGFQGFGAGFSQASGSDLFEQLFGAFSGGPSRGMAPERGANVEHTIKISFMEACKGTTKKININPVTDCGTCSGSGLKAGAKRTTCTACGGSGTRTFVIDSGFQMASTCQTCGGVGSSVPRSGQCTTCRGLGKVRSTKHVDIDIPAGMEDGMTIRVPNAGDVPISGKGPTGDLLVRVSIAASKTFKRQGANLYHEAQIPLHTALLGGKVRIPTLDGEVDVRVPGGAQQGEEMVLKGRGVPSVYGYSHGDLFVAFAVVLPRSLTKRQRELIQKYADDVEGRVPHAEAETSGRQKEELPNNDNVKAQNPTGSAEESPPSKEQEAKKKRATG